MHKYQLQRYSGIQSKHRCPQCQHRRKTFSLYLNTETNQPLASHVGRCDRLDKCGYHFTPKQFFATGVGVDSSWIIDHGKKGNYGDRLLTHEPSTMNHEPKLPSTMNHELKTTTHELLKASLSRYQQNNLVQFLSLLFGNQITNNLIERYYIGTSKHWHGATVFWQVDITGQVRAGKIMLYNVTNAKRVKQPFNHITWAHKVVSSKQQTDSRTEHSNTQITQCLFGEHLLTADTTTPIAIVESEKTAIIASVYMPAYIWLATGGLSNLTPQKCAILKNRKVHLYPDMNAYDAWQNKAHELAPIADFKVSPVLEQLALNEARTEGLDIADYLMGFWPL